MWAVFLVMISLAQQGMSFHWMLWGIVGIATLLEGIHDVLEIRVMRRKEKLERERNVRSTGN